MTTFIKQQASPCVIAMRFNSYNAAVQFAQGSGLLNPSKPYKRMLQINGSIVPVWHVTLPNVACSDKKPTFERIAA